MNFIRRFFLIFLPLCIMALIMPFTAFAGDEIEISTAEKLMDVLKTGSSASWDTLGKTYVLQNDIEIDTGDLSATYSSDANYSERQFCGVLDGNGHTITVIENEDGKTSKPLFDRIAGNLNGKIFAGVRNINIIFKGTVEGTTVASNISYAEINNVDITFEKDIVFAHPQSGSASQYAIATGVFGVGGSASPITLSDVSVTGDGIIGSKDAQDKAYVMAAGVYSEWNFAGGEIILDGIDVDVEGIYAVSEYESSPSAYADCCAAGISSGWYQSNLRLGNASVNIAEDIYAHSTRGSDADAYGLGYDLLAMYNCDVIVGGNIEATADIQNYTGSYTSPNNEYIVCAAGMSPSISTKYNQNLFGSAGIGDCFVKVNGDILASAESPNASVSNVNYMATATGCTLYASTNITWEDAAFEAKNIKSITDGYTNAYAMGFSLQEYTEKNSTGSDYDRINCSVKAKSISAISSGNGTGNAVGFSYWGFATYSNCSVDVDIIESEGSTASSSGFVYMFFPSTSIYRSSSYGEIYNCNVITEKITSFSNNDYAKSSGFASSTLEYPGYLIEGAINDCSVIIADEISATGTDTVKALFIAENDKLYKTRNNTVELPFSQADVQTIDDKQYILFTASEAAGRAGETPADTASWESGNRVIFTGKSENDVFCRYDDGSSNGTLWELKETAVYHTVSYDLDGGKGADGEDYDDEYIISGMEITLKAAPTRDDYEFKGWSDGENTYQPGEKLNVDSDLNFKAVWEYNGVVTGDTYTLKYDTNGGKHISSETRDNAWTKYSDDLPSPTRSGYSFKGWYIDADLTIPVGNKIEIDRETVTIYAKWSRNPGYSLEEKKTGVEKILDTRDHSSYLNGYPDGSFRPDGYMTRAEVAQMFYNLFLDKDIPITVTFSDVSDDAWYSRAVNTLGSLGIVKGVVNGIGNYEYEPDRAVTRAEFTAIAMRFADLETSGENRFTDVDENDWFYEQVVGSIQYGWISGYPDGTFRPNNPITRAEVTVITNRMLERDADESYIDANQGMLIHFYDTSTGHWAYYSIMEAVNGHEYTTEYGGEIWIEIKI